MVDGEQKVVAIFLPKVKFSEGENSYNTKGENLEYATPSMSGSATSDGSTAANWKFTRTFAKGKEEDAEKWIKGKLNIA